MSINQSRLYLINAMKMLCANRSTGATIVEMLTGEPPWQMFGAVTATLKIVTEITKPKLPEGCSEALVEFVSKCFIK